MTTTNGIDKYKNSKLNLVAKVKTKNGEVEGFVEAPSLRRMVMGKGKVYIYIKTDRGSVNTIYNRKAYKADFLEIIQIFDKKLKRQFSTLT